MASRDSIQQTLDRGRPAHTSPVSVLVALLLASVLWFTFVGTRAPHELEVGSVCAGFAVLFAAFIQRCSPNSISLHLKDLLQAWRIPWYILSDTAQLTAVLVKDVLHRPLAQSIYRVSRFESGNEDDTHLGRRVLATAYTTATPSIIVIGIDIEQQRMLFHQIERADLPAMTKALGAHP